MTEHRLVTDAEAEEMQGWIEPGEFRAAGVLHVKEVKRLLATRAALMEALEDSHGDCRRVSELLSDYACPGCALLAELHGEKP